MSASEQVPRLREIVAGLLILVVAASFATGSDHGDTPLLIDAQRHDARQSDLFVFNRGDKTVLAVCLDPTIPPAATSYQFAADLTVEIHIDNNSDVTFSDPVQLATFGGTIVEPKRIHSDVRFTIRFDNDGNALMDVNGISHSSLEDIQLFAGLRDDPFIRGPRIGRNIAAIVIELPSDLLLDDSDTLLIWTTSKVPGFRGPFQDMVGRALRSQFPENLVMNGLRPGNHQQIMGVTPDVMIYDTSRAAVFPNGRELSDDVVDLVGDPRVLANDFPFPDENDLPFLSTFPYLSPPHGPSPEAVPFPANEPDARSSPRG